MNRKVKLIGRVKKMNGSLFEMMSERRRFCSIIGPRIMPRTNGLPWYPYLVRINPAMPKKNATNTSNIEFWIAYEPTQHSRKIQGSKYFLGRRSILTKRLASPNPTRSVTIEATKNPANSVLTSLELSTKRFGPGYRPQIMSAPRIIAVTASPGIPSVSIGIKAPPQTPLAPA